MKIALIVPVIDSDVVDEEVSMGISSTMLKDKGHEVLFTTLHENNEDFKQIADFNPSFIAIVAYSDTITYVEKLCNLLKNMINNVKIALLGYAATHHYYELLNCSIIFDFALIGEFEETLCELVNALDSNNKLDDIKGLAYRKKDTISTVINRETFLELDNLPYSDRSIMVQENLNYAKIQGSKGCKINCCSFCCETSFWKKANTTWQGRSPANIVDEIEMIMNKHHIYKFNFNDNNFSDPNRSSERVLEIADLILKRNLPITYFVNIRADFHQYVSNLDTEYMIKSGYRGALIGFEAANQKDLLLFRKATKVEDNILAAEIFKKYGLGVDCGFININPYSTLETLKTNIDFLHQFNYMSYFTNLSRLKLFKGTALFEKAKSDGLLGKSTEMNVFNYNCKDSQVEKIVRFLNDYFYPLNDSHHLMHRVRYFGVYFIQDTLNLLNYFEKVCDDMQAVNLLKECIENIKIELEKFNDTNYYWFSNLISSAENNFNEANVLSMSKDIMSLESIFQYIDRLNKLKFAGFKNIIKHNKDYALVL